MAISKATTDKEKLIAVFKSFEIRVQSVDDGDYRVCRSFVAAEREYVFDVMGRLTEVIDLKPYNLLRGSGLDRDTGATK